MDHKERDTTGAPSQQGSPSEKEGEVELPDLSQIDFTDPEACKELKEEHEECFYDWLKRYTRGEVTTDECQVPWKRYQHCVRVLHYIFYLH